MTKHSTNLITILFTIQKKQNNKEFCTETQMPISKTEVNHMFQSFQCLKTYTRRASEQPLIYGRQKRKRNKRMKLYNIFGIKSKLDFAINIFIEKRFFGCLCQCFEFQSSKKIKKKRPLQGPKNYYLAMTNRHEEGILMRGRPGSPLLHLPRIHWL